MAPSKIKRANKIRSIIFISSLILCVILAVQLFRISRRQPPASVSLASTGMALHTDARIYLNEKDNSLYASSGNQKYILTIDPYLQKTAEDMLKSYDHPPVFTSFVAIEPSTGKILALVSHERKKNDIPASDPYQSVLNPLSRSSIHPMASIAKIITAAAAIEKGIYSPDSPFDCTGVYRTEDGAVYETVSSVIGPTTMGRALATSCNTAFAKIGVSIGRSSLVEYFAKHHFNKPIPFDLPVIESIASVGDSRFHVANTAAGFEGSWMSPLHAAMIAAVYMNDGIMMRPYLVADIYSPEGHVYHAQPQPLATVVKKTTIKPMLDMMNKTVNEQGGTAYRGFYRNGDFLAGDLQITGKTGSLNGNSDAEQYTWLVGTVHGNGREFAFATMVKNDGVWRIKAASFSGQLLNRVAHEKR